MDYKEAGVDRKAGEDFVDQLKAGVKAIQRPEVLSGLGGFGACFEAPSHYQKPVFVATTDGVGTKLLLAEEAGSKAYPFVGQDCVAMCTNDLAASLAEPLVFLDYLATGKLNPKALQPLMEGILEGCRLSSCSLVGGETAEMPGYYPDGRFDVAGFSVGVIEKELAVHLPPLQEGDILVGLPSNGFHSNGYSLIRKIMQKESWSLATEVEGVKLSDYLLRPTEVYVTQTLRALRELNLKRAAHITGGGLIENLPRVLTEGFGIEIQKNKFEVPDVQNAFAQVGGLEEIEAFSTWNMGIGFCWIIPQAMKDHILSIDSQAKIIGKVKRLSDSEPRVKLLS